MLWHRYTIREHSDGIIFTVSLRKIGRKLIQGNLKKILIKLVFYYVVDLYKENILIFRNSALMKVQIVPKCCQKVLKD